MLNLKILLPIGLMSICLLFYCCNSSSKKELSDSLKTETVSMPSLKNTPNLKSKNEQLVTNGNFKFEQEIYLKIDKIYSGQIYTNHKGMDVFYRILEIPEEENITLFAENISLGEEGGKYQLIKRIRLTDDNSVLPRFGLNKVDSLKFIDSVTIVGYLNSEKVKINLNTLKKN